MLTRIGCRSGYFVRSLVGSRECVRRRRRRVGDIIIYCTCILLNSRRKTNKRNCDSRAPREICPDIRGYSSGFFFFFVFGFVVVSFFSPTDASSVRSLGSVRVYTRYAAKWLLRRARRAGPPRLPVAYPPVISAVSNFEQMALAKTNRAYLWIKISSVVIGSDFSVAAARRSSAVAARTNFVAAGQRFFPVPLAYTRHRCT